MTDEAEDVVFETLWGRVLEAWDDDKPHAALLDYALRAEKLPQVAGRYRTLKDDPAKGELAKKKMGAIVLAAESLLQASRSPRTQKVPWPITAGAAGVVAILLFWIAYAFLRR